VKASNISSFFKWIMPYLPLTCKYRSSMSRQARSWKSQGKPKGEALATLNSETRAVSTSHPARWVMAEPDHEVIEKILLNMKLFNKL